jgi:histone-lysine N-methyltransferase SETMAR
MKIVLWDRIWVLMVKFMQQGTTITSHVYCETLKKLRRSIQKRRFGMLTYCLVLHHDARTAASTRARLEHFNWELFDHLPYSLDLAPSNYHLFTYPKNWFGSQRFKNNGASKQG